MQKKVVFLLLMNSIERVYSAVIWSRNTFDDDGSSPTRLGRPFIIRRPPGSGGRVHFPPPSSRFKCLEYDV